MRSRFIARRAVYGTVHGQVARFRKWNCFLRPSDTASLPSAATRGVHQSFVWLIGSLVIVCWLASAVDSAERPGLSAVQPKEGPWVKTDQGYMVPYRMTIPGTDVSFEMIPVSGGILRLKDNQRSGTSDGRPVLEVVIEPYWLGRYEVTWAEYDQYYDLRKVFMRFNALGIRKVTEGNQADAITAPSSLYMPATPAAADESEWPRHPAVSMTQFAARQYTKWLSKLTGSFYRLPSRAEWVFACQAGSTSRFSFGDDEERLSEYGWYFDNSDEETHPVGLKKPNRWGFHDMHGNAREWVLDEYSDSLEGVRKSILAGGPAIQWPTRLHPRAACGGSWDSDAVECQSLSCIGSSESWHDWDPQIPHSPHWMASSIYQEVGFRILRPLNPPAKETHARYWDADVDAVIEALKEYRHIQRGIVDPELPAAIEKLKQ